MHKHTHETLTPHSWMPDLISVDVTLHTENLTAYTNNS